MRPVVTHISNVHRWNDARIYRREILSLVEAGFDVNWIVPVSPQEAPQPHERVNLIPLGSDRSRLARLKTVVEVAASLPSAVVHIHDPELLLVASSLRRVSDAPIVYDKHEYYRGRRGIKARATRMGEIALVGGIDALVVVAEDSSGLPDSDDLLLRGVPVVALPNYPLLEESHPTRRDRAPNTGSDPAQPLRLVYTGVAGWERGLWLMLDLVEELRRRGRVVDLTLAGVCYRSAERLQFVDSLQSRGLVDAVSLKGWDNYLPWEQLYSTLDAADVGLMLMHPDYRMWSNVPTKFYEYMSAGLPFVCSNYGNWRGFADALGVAIPVDPTDAKTCADAVSGLVDSASQWSAMSRAGQVASVDYRWQQVAGRLPELYAQLTT